MKSKIKNILLSFLLILIQTSPVFSFELPSFDLKPNGKLIFNKNHVEHLEVTNENGDGNHEVFPDEIREIHKIKNVKDKFTINNFELFNGETFESRDINRIHFSSTSVGISKRVGGDGNSGGG